MSIIVEDFIAHHQYYNGQHGMNTLKLSYLKPFSCLPKLNRNSTTLLSVFTQLCETVHPWKTHSANINKHLHSDMCSAK